MNNVFFNMKFELDLNSSSSSKLNIYNVQLVSWGGTSTSFVRGVWPQDWKIDPSAD